MAPGADLFVVCKHCGSEVSPYITECPYCGQRLRRRAPKLPGKEEAPKVRHGLLRGRGPRAGGRAPAPQRTARGRRRRTPSALAATITARPYATIAIVAASCVIWILIRAGYVLADRFVVIGPLRGDWWKLLSSQFAYVNGWYAFFTLIVVAIFGWLLERRYGPILVVALFLAAGAAGTLVALAVYTLPIVTGANAAALALIGAWAAPDLRAAREHGYYEGDLLGVAACAALILAIPFAQGETSWLAGVTGGAVGLLVGLGLDALGPAEA